MKINTVSKFGAQVLFGAAALLFAGQSLAEARADVLERIAPVGKVAVEKKAAATAPAATPAEAQATQAVVASASADAVAPAAASAPAAQAAGGDQMALATSSGCMACHQIEMKVVGPAYKEVAAKYKDDAGAIDMLVAKVKAGGVGAWGEIPMPPNAHVSDENIRAIVSWVLTL